MANETKIEKKSTSIQEQHTIKRDFMQFVIYLFVGACATVVEWVAFWIFDRYTFLNYMAATTIAYILSTFANWLIGKICLFTEKSENILKELGQIYLTSVVGLVFNLVIMWCTIDLIGIPNMIAKIIATGIVFIWNFLIRKLLIYKI